MREKQTPLMSATDNVPIAIFIARANGVSVSSGDEIQWYADGEDGYGTRAHAFFVCLMIPCGYQDGVRANDASSWDLLEEGRAAPP